MKLLPMAVLVNMEHELNEAQVKIEKNSENKKGISLQSIIEENQEPAEMTQVEAADMLVKRMEKMDELDFIEKQLNLWLISILDIKLLKKTKNRKLERSMIKNFFNNGNVKKRE